MAKQDSVITDIEIRACVTGRQQFGDDWSVTNGLNFTVITLTDSEGVKGTSFGFGALDSTMAGKAMSAIKPFFMGRNPFDTEKAMKEFENFDRKWNHVPIYAYGPFDNACWDIKGKVAGLPVYKLLGAAREEVPVYVSSGVLPSVDAYVTEALEVKAKGFRGYKLHPPGMVEGGKTEMDIEAYKAVRAAVGPDFALMAKLAAN
jgi:L-alanine-DL-glutamate epimerase-like enolase superfamily enzyme